MQFFCIEEIHNRNAFKTAYGQAKTLKPPLQNPESATIQCLLCTLDMALLISVQPVSVTTLEKKQMHCGKMTLYFGCRQSDMDFIYKDELKNAEELGALSAVHVALSRQPAQPKVNTSHNSAALKFEFDCLFISRHMCKTC